MRSLQISIIDRLRIQNSFTIDVYIPTDHLLIDSSYYYHLIVNKPFWLNFIYSEFYSKYQKIEIFKICLYLVNHLKNNIFKERFDQIWNVVCDEKQGLL
jgi:hypothetical protein